MSPRTQRQLLMRLQRVPHLRQRLLLLLRPQLSPRLLILSPASLPVQDLRPAVRLVRAVQPTDPVAEAAAAAVRRSCLGQLHSCSGLLRLPQRLPPQLQGPHPLRLRDSHLCLARRLLPVMQQLALELLLAP